MAKKRAAKAARRRRREPRGRPRPSPAGASTTRGTAGTPGGYGETPRGPARPAADTPLARARDIFQRYRILFVIYGVGALAGLREFHLSRTAEPVDWGSQPWAEMTEVVSRVNPEDPDTDFLEGVQSIVRGDQPGFVTHFEDALAADVKHNQFLLRDYAQHLLESGAGWREVNDAVNRWRENHPFSDETLTLQLGAGPRSQADVSVLQRELRAVPWIGDAALESYEADGRRGWRVHLTFRPPRTVDVREAVAAVSILSVPEADRVRLGVTCSTLTDCAVAPRAVK